MRGLIVLFSLIPFLLPAQPGQLFERADSLLSAGDTRGAIRQLETIGNDFPQRAYDQSVAYFRISGLRLALGDYEGALAANERSKAIRDDIRLDNTAENYARFGEIYLTFGQYEKALTFLDRARELPFLFPELFAQVNALSAEAYLAMNQPLAALNHYGKAINLLQIEFGEDEPVLSPYLLGAGKAALAAGKPAQARSFFEDALPLTKEVGPVYSALGDAALATGNRVEARDQWLRALRYFDARPDTRRVAVAQTQLAIALLAALNNQDDERDTYLTAAIISLCPQFRPKDGLEYPRSRELILDRLLLSRALALKIGYLLEQEDETALESALAIALEGATILEDHLRYADQGRLRWSGTATAQYFFEVAIQAAYQYFQKNGDEQYLRRAFELAERGRHWEVRLYQMILLQGGAFQEQLNRELPTRQWLREAETALSRDPENMVLGIQVKQRESAIDRLIEGDQTDDPELYRLLYEQRFARDRQLRSLLDDKTTLLAYYSGPHHVFMFALSTDKLEMQRLDVSSDTLAQRIVSLLNSFREKEEKVAVNLAADCYQDLIAPFSTILKKKKKLIIVPHGPLYYLPFTTLPGRVTQGNRIHHQKLRYLGVEYAITLTPSATAWQQWQERRTKAGIRSFSGFAPKSGPGNDELPAIHCFAFDTLYQHSRGMRRAAPDGQRVVFRGTVEVLHEIALVSEQYLPETLTFLEKEASETSCRNYIKEGKYLHLAAPAFVNPHTPGLSGILFSYTESGRQPADEMDGWLQAPEFFRLKPVGTYWSLDGFEPEPSNCGLPGSWYALGGALIQSGVHSAVASLWPETAAAGEYWTLYYNNLLSGASPAAAVQRTCRSMIKEESTAAPWHWGRYLLIGQ